MKKLIYMTIIAIIPAAAFVSCAGSPEKNDEVRTTEDVKEREIIEDYLNREFSVEDVKDSDEAPEERKTRKEQTIKEINESTYRSLTCADILDSLKQSIDIYDKQGDLGVLEYFSELQGDAYFKACLRSNDDFKGKFNDLYMSLSEIRQRKDREAAEIEAVP